MPINAGDAVLKFVGDTSSLDATMASLPGKAKAAGDGAAVAFSGFNDVVDESAGGVEGLGKQAVVTGEEIKTSMRSSTEAVRFLGEESGIRLPRAIARLVGELPGVGTALNLAFSATAVIFAIQMVDTLTKKMFEFANAKENAFAAEQLGKLIAENNEYVKQNKLLNDADAALVAAVDTRTNLQKLTTQLLDQQQALNDASKVDESEILNQKRVAVLKEQIRLTEILIEQQKKADADKEEAENIAYLVRYEKDLENQQELYNKKVAEAKKQNDDFNKTLEEMSKDFKEVGAAALVLPKNVQAILDMRKAAQALSVTLRSDLTAKLQEAQNAKEAFIAVMGTKDAPQLALFDAAITKAAQAVHGFGIISLETKLEQNKAALGVAESELAEARAHGANTKAIEQEIAALKKIQGELNREQIAANKTKDTLSQLSQSAQTTAQQMGSAIASAMQGVLTHQQNFGKAMEKAVFSMLASMAQQWGAYYISIGTAELLTGDPAGGLVLAEGLALEALAGVLGALGSSVGSSGGAGSGGGNGKNNYQYGSSVSDTGSQAGSGRANISVQAFADGGLVTRPTLALIGENATPDNPEIITAPRGTGGNSGGTGGDTHIHFNLPHGSIISADVMGKFVAKMNKMVTKGQLRVQASESFKNTKRGA